MENNQINNINDEKKYNPLKDASFWVAFVLSGGPITILLISKGFYFDPPIILNTVFMLSWILWIIFRKGKKWSFFIGFIFALIVTAVAFYPILQLKENQDSKKIQKISEEINKNQDELIKKIMSQSDDDPAKESRNAKRASDIKMIADALMLYYNDAGKFPKEITSGSKISFNNTTYMNTVPSDPTPGRSEYGYRSFNNNFYSLSFKLEGDYLNLKDGLNIIIPDINAKASQFYTAIDTDKDGLYDKEEEAYGTNINNKDTDGDGYADLSELGNGFDPNKKQP